MKKIFFLICLSFSCLTACSRLDFAFNWADTYIASEVDDYFDISSQQSKSLKKSLKYDFEKMKVAVLPDWITNAQQIQKDLTNGTLNKNEINKIFTSVLSNIERLTSLFSKTAVEFISTTSSNQLEYFTKTFQEKTEEDRQKLQDEGKTEKRLKKYYKYFEMFLGSLTVDQKKLIERHIQTAPFPSELKIRNKEWVFQQFMKKRFSLSDLKNFVKDYLNQPEKFQLPEYQQALQKYYQNLQVLLIEVSETLTPKQKESLRQNLEEKVVQLEKIRRQEG